MTYQPRKGDRVRVEAFDAVVTGTAENQPGRRAAIRVERAEATGEFGWFASEHLTPIEPEYEPGTWWMPASMAGDLVNRPIQRMDDGRWLVPGIGLVAQSWPARPLRRMTVEGES